MPLLDAELHYVWTDLQISGIILYLANLPDNGNSKLSELALQPPEATQVSPYRKHLTTAILIAAF